MDASNNSRKENHSIPAEILDDLASRFIINLPENDRADFVRIYFQVELAHWFYLDFYCTNEENKYRGLVPCGIKQFASHIFNVSGEHTQLHFHFTRHHSTSDEC